MSLLRRHGAGRAHQRTLDGEGRATLRRQFLREAEVEDFGPPFRGHHDILGLEVSVDEAYGMGSRQAFGDLAGEVQGQPAVYRSPLEQEVQGLPLHPLHDNGILVVAEHYVVDLNHRRVAELCGGPGFPAQPFAALRGFLNIVADSLHRHRPAEAIIVGQVDLTHAATAQATLDAVHPDAFRHSARARGLRASFIPGPWRLSVVQSVLPAAPKLSATHFTWTPRVRSSKPVPPGFVISRICTSKPGVVATPGGSSARAEEQRSRFFACLQSPRLGL